MLPYICTNILKISLHDDFLMFSLICINWIRHPFFGLFPFLLLLLLLLLCTLLFSSPPPSNTSSSSLSSCSIGFASPRQALQINRLKYHQSNYQQCIVPYHTFLLIFDRFAIDSSNIPVGSNILNVLIVASIYQ